MRKKGTSNFYLGSVSNSSELNLRQEFLNTINGTGKEIAKGQKGLVRQRRLDSNNKFIKCPCVSKVTGEPDKDNYCPVCMGEGFLWDEKEIIFYRVRSGEDRNLFQNSYVQPGIMNVELEIFYIDYSANLTKSDKIVTLKLDKEGLPILPLERFQIFRIAELREMRLDNGRLEFWKAFGTEE